MATRTLRSPKERLATILTAPFMNCGAKLPVFAMLIAAFFPARHAQAMFLLTLLSWITALLLAKAIRLTILRGPSTPFLLELPPYRLPTFKGLLIHTWERTWQYLQKAGTIILAISILFWALMTFPGLPDQSRREFEQTRQAILSRAPEDLRPAVMDDKRNVPKPAAAVELRAQIEAVNYAETQAALKYSLAGRMGSSLEVLTQWTGFDWRTNVALISGFAAKELIISTFGTAYSLGETNRDEDSSLSKQLTSDPLWNPLKAFALIIFIMLYAPCFPTITCIIKESGSWKWGAFSIIFNTIVALLSASLIYQTGLRLGIGN